MIIPLLFLDVDGVVNAARPGGDFETVAARGWTISYRPAVVDWLNTISRQRLAVVVWLTTWDGDDLDALRSAVGLDEFFEPARVAGQPWAGVGRGWWKVRTIETMLAQQRPPGRPWVWVDDEINHDKHRVSHVPRLMVRTDAKTGLSDDDMYRVERWLHGQKADVRTRVEDEVINTVLDRDGAVIRRLAKE